MAALDPADWDQQESGISFDVNAAVTQAIRSGFSYGHTRVGLLYVSVGSPNPAVNTVRHVLIIPHYDPAVYGYNFQFAAPSVFVRAGVQE